jgi:hypothetical protein
VTGVAPAVGTRSRLAGRRRVQLAGGRERAGTAASTVTSLNSRPARASRTAPEHSTGTWDVCPRQQLAQRGLDLREAGQGGTDRRLLGDSDVDLLRRSPYRRIATAVPMARGTVVFLDEMSTTGSPGLSTTADVGAAAAAAAARMAARFGRRPSVPERMLPGRCHERGMTGPLCVGDPRRRWSAVVSAGGFEPPSPEGHMALNQDGPTPCHDARRRTLRLTSGNAASHVCALTAADTVRHDSRERIVSDRPRARGPPWGASRPQSVTRRRHNGPGRGQSPKEALTCQVHHARTTPGSPDP